MGAPQQGWFESDDDYRQRVAEEANERTIESATGAAPKQGWFESHDAYAERIASEAHERIIEQSTGSAPTQGWFEDDLGYRERIRHEADARIVEDATGSSPNQGWFESEVDYDSRLRREANEHIVGRGTGSLPRQGWFEGDHDYRSRIAHEAREIRAGANADARDLPTGCYASYETGTYSASHSDGFSSAIGIVTLVVALIFLGTIIKGTLPQQKGPNSAQEGYGQPSSPNGNQVTYLFENTLPGTYNMGQDPSRPTPSGIETPTSAATESATDPAAQQPESNNEAAASVAAAATPDPAQSEALSGTWSGTIAQTGGDQGEQPHTVSVSLTWPNGSTDYPELGCAGILEFLGRDEGGLLYREHITRSDRVSCIDGGMVRVVPDGQSLAWRWTKDDLVVSGTLSGQRQPSEIGAQEVSPAPRGSANASELAAPQPMSTSGVGSSGADSAVATPLAERAAAESDSPASADAVRIAAAARDAAGRRGASCAIPDAPPHVVDAATPTYPKTQIGSGRTVTVRVRVTLNETGDVVNISIAQPGADPDFEVEALDAANRSTFAAAVKKCVPQAGTFVYPVEFFIAR